jgi:hypothetical protein
VTLTLALLSPQAWGCDHVEVVVEGVEVDVEDCGSYEYDEDPPMAEVADDEEGSKSGDSLQLQYGTQFLPDLPGHHLSARLLGEKDVYVGGELRYTPSSDLMWTARLGAGLDVFGRSEWDLQLGLFVGTAGEWDRDIDRAVLYAAPIAGTEIAFGYEGRKLYGRYRLLAGLGGGPVDELLTENEITVGYKIVDELHLYGQYLILSPGELDNQGGVGIGVRAEF